MVVNSCTQNCSVPEHPTSIPNIEAEDWLKLQHKTQITTQLTTYYFDNFANETEFLCENTKF